MNAYTARILSVEGNVLSSAVPSVNLILTVVCGARQPRRPVYVGG